MRGYFQDRAIILSRRNIGEADRLVKVLFMDRGRETLVARGVRKAQAKLKGMLEPGMEVDLYCAKSKALAVLTGATIISAHQNLTIDYQGLVVAQSLLEITERTIAEHSPEPEWFSFLSESLGCLADCPDNHQLQRLVWVTALIKNLNSHGLSPTLRLNTRFFHVRDGIFMQEGGVELSESAIKLWRVCRDHSLAYISKIAKTEDAFIELESTVWMFWRLQTGIESLRSRSLAGS